MNQNAISPVSNVISGSETIGLTELRDLLASGEPVLIAEILPAKNYDAGHIPGALNLPLEGFETNATALAPDTSARIVVYCASSTCANSDIAARKLRALGYTNVRVFQGGKAAWTDAGLSLSQGAA